MDSLIEKGRSRGKALDRDAKTIKNWIENYPEFGYKFLNN